ncbi:MAG: hypothetical protein AB8B69_07680, partial [Chitinophagales bacterium]
MSKYHIDDIFREELRDYEVFPSSSVWENIELPPPIPFYRKPAFITSMVVGVALLVGAILFNNSQNTSSNIANFGKKIIPQGNNMSYMPHA